MREAIGSLEGVAVSTYGMLDRMLEPFYRHDLESGVLSKDDARDLIYSFLAITDVKHDVLGVHPGPVVSEPAALEMAHGARRVLGADVALALTGVAGPAEQDGMPAGTLCVGLVWPDGELTRTLRLPGLREQMRQFSVISALDLLRRTLG